MITRVWHGRTSHEDADDYLRFLLGEGTREYLQTEGNLSVKVWQKKEKECCHFRTVTEWTGIAAVKSFAGNDHDKAKYYPQDEGVLCEFEEKVSHYECFDVSATKTKNFIRQLEQLYDGGSWQGESFKGKLDDVDETEAFAEPVPGVHSIAEIVWHCIYWRTVLLKRVEGNRTYRDETMHQLNFLPLDELKEKGWYQLRRELDETQQSLLQVLNEKRDGFLKGEYQPGCTYDYLFEGVIQHDVYHLGQIGLIRRLIV